jgi:hypothetical protein
MFQMLTLSNNIGGWRGQAMPSIFSVFLLV